MMSRRDLGFVVSRMLAVLVFLQTLRQVGMLVPLIRPRADNPNWPWESVTILVAELGLAWMLWDKAHWFGGKEESTPPPLGVSPVSLRRIFFATLGLYVTLSYGATLLNEAYLHFFAKTWMGAVVQQSQDLVEPVVGFAVGLMLLLMNGPTDGERDDLQP